VSYNILPYSELLKIAKAIIDSVPIKSPDRGIEMFELSHNVPVVAKERPRDGTFHTPKKTRDYEEAVRNAASVAMHRAGLRAPFAFPLKVVLEIRQAAPKSWSQSQQYLARQRLVFVLKRDMDNMEKAVMDACNGIVFKDDRQLVQVLKTNVVSNIPGFVARFSPIGLTTDETARTLAIIRQLNQGKLG